MAINVAAGAGLINMSHEVLYIIIAVAGTYFLGSGIARGMKEHWKRGTGSALSSIAGGVLLAVVVYHIVSLYQRGNQEFEQLPGGPGHSNVRGW
ncbi:hypothetical protein KXD96_27325 [Mycobacterium sp. SMC-2]|uniref:hypothetical protein n=1 Tax=Mycobacterium TaxID=1763 RepID=UPI001CE14012|nr:MULTISPECIES: hypothetical protein [Mycobacterium]MCA4761171.1 hypothetical protein [Mycobacterium avium subsp. hominissuis]UXA06495.1 hypothetical protein KXD96_27325 [Mycobacterium sp. SMC-2]